MQKKVQEQILNLRP